MPMHISQQFGIFFTVGASVIVRVDFIVSTFNESVRIYLSQSNV